jgi:hypothetical protein
MRGDVMARKATGTVVEHIGRDGGTYRALRFTAYGKRRFVSLGPIPRGEAERELRHALADVERGTWQPPQSVEAPPEPDPAPTFHQFAEGWWLLNEGRLEPRTRKDYRWRLESHLCRTSPTPRSTGSPSTPSSATSPPSSPSPGSTPPSSPTGSTGSTASRIRSAGTSCARSGRRSR